MPLLVQSCVQFPCVCVRVCVRAFRGGRRLPGSFSIACGILPWYFFCWYVEEVTEYSRIGRERLGRQSMKRCVCVRACVLVYCSGLLTPAGF
jgi:hypothetical protein